MMRKLRVRRGVLQTPVIRYRHRGTGRTVTLVGTVHVGEVSYYKRLQATVLGLEAAGAVVCYESISPAAAEEWAAASVSERKAGDAQRATGQNNVRQVCRSLGWVEQGAAFIIGPSWRNADMTDLELVRLERPEALDELHEATADMYGSLTPDQVDAFVGASSAVLFRVVALDWFDRLRHIATWDDASRRVNHVQIEERNARALASLPSGTDAVLLWGAGHLPGLAAALKETGHRRKGTTWLDVGRLPALWASTRIIFKHYPAIR